MQEMQDSCVMQELCTWLDMLVVPIGMITSALLVILTYYIMYGCWRKLPGKPLTRPERVKVRQNSITLKWGEPEYGADLVIMYTVHYRLTSKSPGEWKKVVIKNNSCTADIKELMPDTEYEFKVVPEGKQGFGRESDVSDPIKTKKLLAIRMKEASEKISGHNKYPELYALPFKFKGGRRFVIGDPSLCDPTNEKVLMLLGETGAGKTTLIDAIVNYILGVRWEDNFRFTLAPKSTKNQACSQTKMVTAYTFYYLDGSQIPYVLTIIDTPGFGDTGGLKEDEKARSQIRHFFSIGGEHGIDHFNGVGIVVQASHARLTPTQKYIFDSTLGVLAKDVESNMFLMVTFADRQEPQVLSAVKEAEIPYHSLFKFNNCSLRVNPDGDDDDDNVDKYFWGLGMSGVKVFLNKFGKIAEVSIEQSKTVTMKREQLEAILLELQRKIATGLENMITIRKEKEKLQECENEIRMSKNFTYTVTTTKRQQKQLPDGQLALNCQNCFCTCHCPCELNPILWNVQETDMYSCIVMNVHDRSVACCTICPSKCGWERHCLQKFQYEHIKIKEERIIKSFKLQFDAAKNESEKIKSVIKTKETELSEARKAVKDLIEQARECQHCLNIMAMKPGINTSADYIDILIKSEENEKKDDYLQRIEALKELKKASELQTELLSERDFQSPF